MFFSTYVGGFIIVSDLYPYFLTDISKPRDLGGYFLGVLPMNKAVAAVMQRIR